MDVDWTKPIEVVSYGGEVRPAIVCSGPDSDGDYVVNYRGVERLYVRRNGEVRGLQDRIRNVQPAAAKRSGISPELADRMAQHLRGMAAQYDEGNHDIDYAFAKELVAELPEPVDADEKEVSEILAVRGWREEDDIGFAGVSVMMKLALQRGRALEREGK